MRDGVSLYLSPVASPHDRIPRQEFHVRAAVRDALSLEKALFSLSGTAVFADIQAARTFAYDFERHRVSTGHPDPSVRPGEIVAMGIMDEILHHMLATHRREAENDLLGRALDRLRERLGNDEVEASLHSFCSEFPPAAVYRGDKSIAEYLDERVDGLSGRERTIEEIVLLRLTNENPATARYGELFDETTLTEGSSYGQLFGEIERFYESEPTAEAAGLQGGRSVLELLRSPSRAHPHSLEDQLTYARDQWGAYVGKFLSRIMRSMDVLREEEKVHADPGAGPPPAEVYRYDDANEKRFSPDTDWMPGVVMIAKSTLVWLFQLSKRYGSEITRLDQIPDEEIDRLAASGFNALWLIGIWERSPASRRIKHLTGNPDAEASAYALYSYDIAQEIGGRRALENLRRRCSDRGIRLASDMVPNHTGIDSPWVHDHPDWYVRLDHPPFPSYSFTGENLSGRDDVGVYLEDHYFDRTDASVVFKHVDSGGRARFIYHGNDGTSMPWNDTAQLNYLNPEVREAVIQTILHVARNFPVIRFDAAMTLAKKHYRRLWYPEPGSGGDIASRAEHGLTRDEFDRAMPQEFWRDVVDRVAAEAPGTLLLAEAFWMMEGYFVRSLGMHRVYNSAFMNMLKREQNAQYREIIKSTLAFDPEILKRFVNFMNNPDEETAVTQFGTGDKYFGVATLLATLPGLPMFGHGQIEGLAEKYGMEFRRPYWDEHPDGSLIARHEHEIFPLLRRRGLFASAASFRLYDVRGDDGLVNENAFVFSNEHAGDRVLVAYNNSYERAVGTIMESAPYQTEHGERRETIDAAFGVSDDETAFLVFQEQRSGLWYLRKAREVRERGLHLSIDGYRALVFWKVHERIDADGRLAQLEADLAGSGVADIDVAMAGMRVRPVREAFAAVATETLLAELGDAMQGFRPVSSKRFDQIRADYRIVLEKAASLAATNRSVNRGLTSLERHLSTLVSLPHRSGGKSETTRFKAARGFYYTGIRASEARRRLLAQWVLLGPLAEVVGDEALSWGIEMWIDGTEHARLLRTALERSNWAQDDREASALMHELLGDSEILSLIGYNTHSGVDFYHLESMSELLWTLFAVALIRILSTSPAGGTTVERMVERAYRVISELEEANQYAQGRAELVLSRIAAGSRRRPPQEQDGASGETVG
ncbi:MAG: alpha-amylase family glycosyl hydrolase [Spirochaetota bacterium]